MIAQRKALLNASADCLKRWKARLGRTIRNTRFRGTKQKQLSRLFEQDPSVCACVFVCVQAGCCSQLRPSGARFKLFAVERHLWAAPRRTDGDARGARERRKNNGLIAAANAKCPRIEGNTCRRRSPPKLCPAHFFFPVYDDKLFPHRQAAGKRV